ncbi:hypothetical protein F5882DRAFT_457301 [Hyaloscypha sp. PMI_1271]|nr:hypothetical protein F5882DRAFT_457301 [Hyaloscypha sp. PMI_1271]
MSLLGKKFPAPIAKPMTPFFVAGTSATSRGDADCGGDDSKRNGVNSFANVMMNSDEFKNDPKSKCDDFQACGQTLEEDSRPEMRND